MSKCKTRPATINSRSDKVQIMDKITISYSKLDHVDKITIDKMKFVWEEAQYCGRWDVLRQIANKHLVMIKNNLRVGEYSLNQDKICLMSDGLDYFIEANRSTLEQQVAKTISHEIMHSVLFYEHGENETRAFDNIAEKLKAYGMW